MKTEDARQAAMDIAGALAPNMECVAVLRQNGMVAVTKTEGMPLGQMAAMLTEALVLAALETNIPLASIEREMRAAHAKHSAMS